MASRCAATFGSLLVMAAAAAGGQAAPPPLEQVLDASTALSTFRATALAPDGRRVAWVETVRDPAGRLTSRGALFVAERQSAGGTAGWGAARRITAAAPGKEASEGTPFWAPDSHRLGFLSNAGGEGSQIYLVDLADPAGPPRQVTQLKGHLGTPLFSPDGRSIAFLHLAGPREAGPRAAAAREVGEVGQSVDEQRLTLLDLASGTVRPLSPEDLYVYEYDWAADGRSFAATAAHGSGDDHWYVAELYTLRADSGETRSIWKPSCQITYPRFSPDGRSVAVIGGLMSDSYIPGGDIFLVPTDGGAVRNLTPGRPASPAWLGWAAPNRILFMELADADTAIATLELPSGRTSTLWHAPEFVADDGPNLGLSLGRDGRSVAVIRHDFTHPPEVWAGPIGAWQPVTHGNARFTPSWGAARSLRWTTDAPGGTVQGWLLAPPTTEPGRRYPLVVLVHGGPASAHHAAWQGTGGILASQGFYVLLPNPRGSYGQGEAFTRGNVKDFGHGDLRDILAGVDAALGSGVPIDGNRVGISGWSYGGYMTMWAVTQTDRFHAAVAGAGIANWQSYYGQNGIDQWMLPYFGASVYDDPLIYARSSPITFIARTKTPTLILQGERDAEVPAPQAYEFWHALKTLGVATQLVVYPDEGHNLVRPEDNRDRYRRTFEWFEKYLK